MAKHEAKVNTKAPEATGDVEDEEDDGEFIPKKKKGLPLGVRILLWIGIVALVIFLTLFIVAMIVPDERINSIGDLINYLVTEFKAL